MLAVDPAPPTIPLVNRSCFVASSALPQMLLVSGRIPVLLDNKPHENWVVGGVLPMACYQTKLVFWQKRAAGTHRAEQNWNHNTLTCRQLNNKRQWKNVPAWCGVGLEGYNRVLLCVWKIWRRLGSSRSKELFFNRKVRPPWAKFRVNAKVPKRKWKHNVTLNMVYKRRLIRDTSWTF